MREVRDRFLRTLIFSKSIVASQVAPYRGRAYPSAWARLRATGFKGPWAQNAEELALDEQFFHGHVGGVFVEMGALDGLIGSNTLAFERVLNWTGVLIEANPAMCQKLRANRPGMATLCTAVSGDRKPVAFRKGLFSSTFGEEAEMDADFKKRFHSERRGPSSDVIVPSAPLSMLLRMVGLRFVDLFSLDVEGAELKVLHTHDWSLPVRVWCIEVNSASKSAALATFMNSKGYRRTAWDAGARIVGGASSDKKAPAERMVTARKLDKANKLWVWNGTWTPSEYAWHHASG